MRHLQPEVIERESLMGPFVIGVQNHIASSNPATRKLGMVNPTSLNAV